MLGLPVLARSVGPPLSQQLADKVHASEIGTDKVHELRAGEEHEPAGRLQYSRLDDSRMTAGHLRNPGGRG
jgi:hypothetical protein